MTWLSSNLAREVGLKEEGVKKTQELQHQLNTLNSRLQQDSVRMEIYQDNQTRFEQQAQADQKALGHYVESVKSL